jgi:mono/diheme cytochrome c family protein
VTGGTLLVTHDGQTAVASDPDRDVISLIDLASHSVMAQFQLPTGAEPGRVVEDGSGQVHAILRRGGGIADIDVYGRSLVRLRQTCALPRGIAFRSSDSTLLVSCLTGQLITMSTDPSQAAPLATVTVQDAKGPITDLRDVLLINDTPYVTTFRSANVVAVGAGGLVAGSAIALNPRVDPSAAELAAANLPGGTPQTFEPAVAWRSIVGPAGDIIVAHEAGTNRVINVSLADNGGTQTPVVTTCTQAEPGGQFCTQSCDSSEYGGTVCTTTCSTTPPVAPVCTSTPGAPICAPPILIGAVSSVAPATGIVSDGPNLPEGALPVDIVATPDKQSYVVALAGNPSGTVGADGSPLLNILTVPAVNTAASAAANAATFDGDLCGVAFAKSGITVPGQVTAVALDGSGQTVAQTREPAAIQYVTASGLVTIPLSNVSVADEGYNLFHTNTGRGMTCAGCHAEGGDDGRTWSFTDGFDANGAPVAVKPRRTQTFRAGFLATAPFHWDGEFAGVPALMSDVFVHRMAAPTAPTPAQEGLLETWMNGIPPKMHDAPSPELASSIAAGKTLFEDSAVGCTSCHGGSNFTNNEDEDIGFGYALQTPTLIDVAFRAPYLHDGSVPTLLARFSDPTAMSGKHGTTAQLTPAQIGDLVAYLGSL